METYELAKRMVNRAADKIAHENPYEYDSGGKPTVGEIRLARVAVVAALRELAAVGPVDIKPGWVFNLADTIELS